MKPIVLTFVHFYLPGYKSGGPVRTIENMVNHLGQQLDFRIVCLDRDSGDRSPFGKVFVNAWNAVGHASVFYASPDFMRPLNIHRLLKNAAHDVLYLNSFFDPRFTLLPLLVRRVDSGLKAPVVLAPRGEFSPGALEIKAWKKKPYIAITKRLDLYRDVTWQASSVYESQEIDKALESAGRSIVVAPDLSPRRSDKDFAEANGVTSGGRGECDRVRVVFLSRVSPKKNLDFALDVVGRVKAPIIFDVYGPISESSYWERCKVFIDALPANVRFNYHGPLEHSQVNGILAGYDLFFLPTKGENYGHVILEALSVGTPVLISDQTPWRDLDGAGVGWVRPLQEKRSFVEVIELVGSQTRDARWLQRERVRAYARRVATDADIVARNLSLFLDLVGI